MYHNQTQMLHFRRSLGTARCPGRSGHGVMGDLKPEERIVWTNAEVSVSPETILQPVIAREHFPLRRSVVHAGLQARCPKIATGRPLRVQRWWQEERLAVRWEYHSRPERYCADQ